MVMNVVKSTLLRTLLLCLAFGVELNAQNTFIELQGSPKLSDGRGGYGSGLANSDFMGSALSFLGDVNGDTIPDFAFGAPGDDDGNTNAGALYVILMNLDQTVNSKQKISETDGNFTGSLDQDDNFGRALCYISDLDGDTINELIVGAPGDDDGGSNKGAIYVLFLNDSGKVKRHKKISDISGNFSATIDANDQFGFSLANLGDLNGDGIEEIAVGAIGDDDGGTDRGAAYVLYLDTSGVVDKYQKISSTAGSFSSSIANGDNFGSSLAGLGDFNGDNIPDIAIGAYQNDDGGNARGAVWVCALDTGGSVKKEQKISNVDGNFGADLNDNDLFGIACAGAGDLDGDGFLDLAVGASGDDDGGTNKGAVYLLYLDTNGIVNCFDKVSETSGGFTTGLDDNDEFGFGLTAINDFDSNGLRDLLCGAPNDDDGGTDRGAAYIFLLREIDLGPDRADTTVCRYEELSIAGKHSQYVNWFNSANRLISRDSTLNLKVFSRDTIIYYETGNFARGCTYFDTLTISIKKSGFAPLSNFYHCGINAVKLGPDSADGALKFLWYTNDTTVGLIDTTALNPYVDVEDSSTIYVQITDTSSGCVRIDSQVVYLSDTSGCSGNCGDRDEYGIQAGGTKADEGTVVFAHSSGRYFIAGATESYGAGNKDFYLSEVSPNGTILWTNTYGGSSEEIPYSISEASNGDLIITGRTTTYGGTDRDMYVVRTSVIGKLIWSKYYGGSDVDIAFDALSLNSGDMLLHQHSRSYTNTSGSVDVNLVKLRGDGSTIRTHKRFGGSLDEGVANLLEIDNYNYLGCGMTASSNSNYYGLLYSIDTNLNFNWVKTYGGTKDDRFFYVTEGIGGGFLAVGWTTSTTSGGKDIFIVKTKNDGSVDWAKAIGGSNDDVASSALRTSDGGYIILATTESYGKGNEDILMMRIKSDGDIDWARTYGQSGDDFIDRKGQSLIETRDGYMFTASMNLSGQQSVLIKTDYKGNSSECYGQSVSPSSQNFSVTASNASFSMVNVSSMSSGNGGSVGFGLFQDSLICKSFCVNFTNSVSCGNTPVEFTDLSYGSATSWYWTVTDSTDGSADTSTSQNPSFNLNQGTYYVTLKASNGSDTLSISKKVNVYSGPSYVNTNDTIICSGDSVNLFVLGGDSIKWSSTYPNLIDTAYSQYVKPTSNTQFKFTIYDTTYQCNSSDSVLIQVQSLPQINMIRDTAICFGDSARVTAVISTDSFSWTPTSSLSQTDTLSPYFKPSSNTDYVLTAVDNIGCSSTDTLTVRVFSIPNISGQNSYDFCPGDSVQLIVSGGVRYDWSTGDTTDTIYFSPAGDTSLLVAAINANGCFSEVDTIQLNAENPPVIIIQEFDTVCYNTTKTYSTRGAFAYEWSNGGSSNSLNVRLVQDSIFAVRGISGTGCQGPWDSLFINVRAQLAATAAPDDTICRGDSITLSASGNGDFLIWNTGDTTANLAVAPQFNSSYRVKAGDNFGCESAWDTIRVVINQRAQTNAGNDDSLCLSDTLTLSAIGGNSWQWSTGETSRSILVSPPNDTTYWLISTNSFGCAGDTDFVNVKVNPLPSASIIGNDSACIGSRTILIADGGTSYQWSNGSVSDTIRPRISSDLSFVLTAFNNFGCEDEDTLAITAVAIPDLITSGPDTICFDEEAVLWAENTDTIRWSTGLVADTLKVSPAASTFYIVFGINDFGCSSEGDTLNVTVIEKPSVDLDDELTACTGDSVYIIADSLSRFSYEWLDGSVGDSFLYIPTEADSIDIIASPYNAYCSGENDTLLLVVLDKATVQAGPDQDICFGDSIQIRVEDEGLKYVWSTGEEGPSIWVSPRVDTFYTVTSEFQNNSCQSDPDTIEIDVFPTPTADFRVSSNTGIAPHAINVSNLSSGGIEHTWYMGDSIFENNSQAFPYSYREPDQHQILLIVRNEFNCIDTAIYDSMFIVEDVYIMIPNAFTPNGDGKNDSFAIRYPRGVQEISGKIFNRWGEEVYQWDGMNWWDGTFRREDCQVDVYIYVIDVVDMVGEPRRFQGNVTLIR